MGRTNCRGERYQLSSSLTRVALIATVADSSTRASSSLSCFFLLF
uniref:Uncharacterized protein n=1 Tax=Hydatigena taeniaeformis TaxID=6205 RepID=A0A0R3X4G7_HYDTA